MESVSVCLELVGLLVEAGGRMAESPLPPVHGLLHHLTPTQAAHVTEVRHRDRWLSEL